MQVETPPRRKIRVRGRSFMAFVIAPEPPLDAWLAELDARIARSPGFFEARPVIIDLVAVTGHEAGTGTLLTDLGTVCLNTIAPADPALPGFRLVTTPTALQREAFALLGVSHRLGTA